MAAPQPSAPQPSAEPRAPLRAREHVLPLGTRTYVMAILNLTDNSFSGDGTGGDLDAAVRRAVAAAAEGADIVDVGAESARADVPVRDADEEATIAGAAIARIRQETDVLVSADTYKGAVAEAAMQAGACIINDIGGFKYGTDTARIAAKYGAALVINYTYERPKIRPAAPPQYDDLIGAHMEFLRERMSTAIEAGVNEDALILDPGIAFGKSHDEDIQVLRRLGEFQALGRPLLVAASRKHFIGSVLGVPPEERDVATAAVTALNISYGADLVRVHDVRTTVQAARMADAIVRGHAGEYAPTPESWPWARDAKAIPGTQIRSAGEN
jgi:dihydropteroate synthase